MKSIEQTISDSIRFDNFVTGNAQRILENLRAEGYEVVPRGESVDLPELMRVFGKTQVSAEQAEFWVREAFNHGAKSVQDHTDLARLRAVEGLLPVAADALSDCVWILRDKPQINPLLPDPVPAVIEGAIIAENSLRSALSEPAAEGDSE